jgi:hypothetical protein
VEKGVQSYIRCRFAFACDTARSDTVGGAHFGRVSQGLEVDSQRVSDGPEHGQARMRSHPARAIAHPAHARHAVRAARVFCVAQTDRRTDLPISFGVLLRFAHSEKRVRICD